MKPPICPSDLRLQLFVFTLPRLLTEVQLLRLLRSGSFGPPRTVGLQKHAPKTRERLVRQLECRGGDHLDEIARSTHEHGQHDRNRICGHPIARSCFHMLLQQPPRHIKILPELPRWSRCVFNFFSA